MYRIGVTGGIGSGKSTFCRLLAGWGAVHFDADQEATRIMESDPHVMERIVKLLGPSAYTNDGTIARSVVARAVFSDQNLLSELGKIVHPMVYRAFHDRGLAAEKAGAPAIVREAALPPDEHNRKDLDLVVAVLADPEVRIRRVMDRSRLTREQVEARMAAQPSTDAFEAIADVIILNNGSEKELAMAASTFWNSLSSP